MFHIRIKTGIVFSLLLPFALNAQQQYDFSDSAVECRLKKDLFFLASDSLKGRETGTENAIVARDYIVSEFKKAGLSPFNKADSSYFQKSEYSDNYWDDELNTLVIDDANYKLWSDFYPMAGVGEGFVSGSYACVDIEKIDTLMDLPEAKDKIVFLYNVQLHSVKILLEDAVRYIEKNGAHAIIIVPDADFYSFYSKQLSCSIPVFIFEKAKYEKIYFQKETEVKLQLFSQASYDVYNVIGTIDNKASCWIVLGGHYDHLGIRKDASSGAEKIYNGADDNASGTVAVMELARYLKQQGPKNYNYILCAFSGEEKGLLGSYAFTDSKFFDTTNVKYMLDFDMVGRLGAFGDVLYVNGVGSSRQWKKIIRDLPPADFKIKKIPDGMDGSDDYPFYKKGVPVLFFITGLHSEYHTPADDPEKINYKGETSIVKYVRGLIENIPPASKLKFRRVTAWQTVRSYIIYAKMFM
jgi:aminopeptidase YwaD